MRPVAHPYTPGPARVWRREAIETGRLAGPLALANLLQMLTYAIDVVFIARLGADELAASALTIAVFGLVVWALQGLTGALAPIAAAEIGARGPALRPVRRTVRMALWIAVLLGGLAMIPCLAAEPLMRATGQEPRIADLAGDYMGVLMLALVPQILAGVLRSFVSTLGRALLATIITALGIGINALGNYAFIFGNLGAPPLGLRGAALATLITSCAMFVGYVLAIRLDRRLHRYHVFGFVWRPDWARFREILRVGAPIAGSILAEAGIFGAAAFLMGMVGPVELAAHTVALQIAALAFQVPFGIGQAATIRVGYFHGARDAAGVMRAGWTAVAMSVAFAAVTAGAMLFAPRTLLSIYLDVEDPANAALIGLAVTYLLVAAAFQFSDGLQAVAAGALRGLKDTRVPMWLAIVSYWGPGFGVAVVLAFWLGLGGLGVWLGLATGLTFAAGLQLRRWSRRGVLGLV